MCPLWIRQYIFGKFCVHLKSLTFDRSSAWGRDTFHHSNHKKWRRIPGKQVLSEKLQNNQTSYTCKGETGVNKKAILPRVF